MPGIMPVYSSLAKIVIDDYKKKRADILATLAPEIQKELDFIDQAIDIVRTADWDLHLENIGAKQEKIRDTNKKSTTNQTNAGGLSLVEAWGGGSPPVPAPQPSGVGRIPLAEHKENLFVFLVENGTCHRNEIAKRTGIPAGSLSTLLAAEEFEARGKGFWGLKRPFLRDRLDSLTVERNLIANALANEPLTEGEICEKTGLDMKAISLLLRYGGGRFENTENGKWRLRVGKTDSEEPSGSEP